jgi:hypothetical protein
MNLFIYVEGQEEELFVNRVLRGHLTEDINEMKATSPSHRIFAHVPTYQKIDGFRHLQDIGLPELKAHCPRFREWIDRCEKFFR